MKKDGHTDVASSRRMCMTIIEDANDILDALPSDMEAALPTWWTNKLAVFCYDERCQRLSGIF